MKTKILLVFVFITSLCNAQILTIPDANFKTKLLGASPSNSIAKDLSGNYFSIDSNNDGEIQQCEADAVSELYLNDLLNGMNYPVTSVIGITNFNNLTKLDVSFNSLIDLNVSGMQHLTYINCSNNDYDLISLTIENLPLLETLICWRAGSSTLTPFYSFLNLPSLKTIEFIGCNFLLNTLDDLINLENIYGTHGFHSLVTSLDLSNKPNLKIVELDGNSLSELALIPNNNIEILKLQNNKLTSFDRTIFTNLKILDVSWNELGDLDVSNMSSLIELNCDVASTSFSYNLTSLNVQGCTNLTKLICSRNSLTNLDLSNLTKLCILDCQLNHDIFTNTGLHAINLKDCVSLKKVKANGNVYLTELDLSCSNNYDEIRVQGCENLQKINLKNGADESSMYAGTFSYSSCPNLTLIGVDFNENFLFLPASIQQSPYYDFTPNCSFNTVIGNVKFDIEGDGCQNNAGIEGIKIHYNCSVPDCFTFSDSQGNFILYTQSDTISIMPENNLYPLFDFGLTGPIVLNFTPTSNLEYVNLCLAPNTAHNDVEIAILPIELARPGFDAKYKIIYKNNGNQVESGSVNLTFADSIMDLVSSNPIANATMNNLQWSFSNFLPFETRAIDLILNINSPTEIPPVVGGTILNYSAVITGSPLDENPNDNISNLSQTVLNSFDPNNKICLEGQNVFQNIIGNDVHYIINFENSGTANAQNIVVRDIIDTSKFDISTLKPIGSSHNVNIRIINTNEVEFIFQDINLPFDDANNDGFIAFKIKTNSSLIVGDSFSNSANIYFDYNYPIITNNFVTTIQIPLGLQENKLGKYITIYPNPVKDILYFSTLESISKVEVYDVYGRLLSSKRATDNKVDLQELKPGNYFLKAYEEKRIMNAKIVKE